MMSADPSKYTIDMEYVKACQLACGLSYKAIAQSQGLSESTVSRFFAGQKSSDIFTVCSILDAVGASIDRAYGIVKPVAEAVTEPMPNLAAVATDVIQALPPLVNEQRVATRVVEALKDSPVASDPKEIARAVVEAMPPHDCDSCRTSRLYESTISQQSRHISALIRALCCSVGLLVLVLLFLLLRK